MKTTVVKNLVTGVHLQGISWRVVVGTTWIYLCCVCLKIIAKMAAGSTLVTKKNYQRLKYYKTLISTEKQKRVIAPYVATKPIIPEKKKDADIRKEEYFEMYAQNKPTVLMQNLTEYFTGEVSLATLLEETASVLKATTKATAARLYMIDDSKTEIYLSTPIESRHKINWKIEKGTTVAAHVAFTKEFVMVDDVILQSEFPDGIGYDGESFLIFA